MSPAFIAPDDKPVRWDTGRWFRA